MEKNILVTGGAGFIGTNLLEYMLETYTDYNIICYDALTYASNPKAMDCLMKKYDYFKFINGDITDVQKIQCVFREYDITDVIHLAAESHVDRSINNPYLFEETNVKGTLVLLDTALRYWSDKFHTLNGHRFHHVSTDEVYGSLELDSEDKFNEEMKYHPNSPYSASKAASDHFVNAYHVTYGMETTITNCSNNYGPYQHNEKFIPTVLSCIKNKKSIPVYGDGKNVRDWLYVTDHAKAICHVFHNGIPGETYCVGGDGEKSNLEVIQDLMNVYIKYVKFTYNNDIDINELKKLITFVDDRKGHDKRYALSHEKISKLGDGWKPETTWEDGLLKTINYYMQN